MGFWGDDAGIFVVINEWPDTSGIWSTCSCSSGEGTFVGVMHMTLFDTCVRQCTYLRVGFLLPNSPGL